MSLKPIEVKIDGRNVLFTIGDGTVVYSTDINAFKPNSGVTIKNIELSELEGYYIVLAETTKTYNCGHIFDNIIFEIKKEIENGLIIIDFSDVEEITESFLASYTKFILETSNKIITINMSPAISNDFAAFIKEKINQVEE